MKRPPSSALSIGLLPIKKCFIDESRTSYSVSITTSSQVSQQNSQRLSHLKVNIRSLRIKIVFFNFSA